MTDKKKDEKKKEVTLPQDFIDGRKGLQSLAEWGSDYLQRMGEDERRNTTKDR